jgi:DNA-directed RNA polymerase specialized sigma subunit
VAGRVSVGLPPNIEQADLVSYGIFGLMDAIEQTYVALENRLHRSPTDAEVAQQLGITTDELHQIFNQISFVSVVALDELLSVGSERGDRLSLVDTLEDKGAQDPVAVVEFQEMKGILAGAINRLGEREKIIITLYHYEGLTLAEIGRVLASPSRASARCTPRRCSSSGPRCRTPASAGRLPEQGAASFGAVPQGLRPRPRMAVQTVVHNFAQSSPPADVAR